MYLIITFSFIGGLAIGLLFIVVRKFPYLKKLSAETESASRENLWADFFPELHQKYRSLDFGSYRVYWLKEFEKFLRRLRVVSLKLESLTNNLLRQVRSKNLPLPAANLSVEQNDQSNEPVSVKIAKSAASREEESKMARKKEEQSLIIEIAKNPKNPELYRRLGQVYLQLKNWADARESLETALKLDPADEKTKEKLDKLVIKNNKPT